MFLLCTRMTARLDNNISQAGAAIRYTVFGTALGWFGLAWSETGIVRSHLPGLDQGETERRMLLALGSAVKAPSGNPDVETMIVAYAEGARVDFTGLPLDLAAISDPLRLAVYDMTRRLPYGQTTTYGALAEAAGFPGRAREVGHAMGTNPVPLIIPCHRVVAAGGKSGGFSAPGGAESKLRMLGLERARPVDAAQASFAF